MQLQSIELTMTCLEIRNTHVVAHKNTEAFYDTYEFRSLPIFMYIGKDWNLAFNILFRVCFQHSRSRALDSGGEILHGTAFVALGESR